MVAIHAWRSADAVRRFKVRYPERPLILQLSGTDIYHYISAAPEPTLRSMELADRLVALNSLAWRVVPKRFRKLRVIFQSAGKLPRQPSRRRIDISVIGHLRDVKDPLRAAEAARPTTARFPESASSISATPTAPNGRQSGGRDGRQSALSGATMSRAPLSRGYCSGAMMVLSSLSEGGANVISEAIVVGVPILASRMDGNVACWAPIIPGIFQSGTPRRWRDCCSGSKAIPVSAALQRDRTPRALVQAEARGRRVAKAARGTVRATLIDASTPPTGTVRPVIAVCSYREAWRDDESGCNMAP
jgi:hypothetical protein